MDHPDAAASVPTPDHFLPLLVVAGAAEADDEFASITEGPDGAAVSMRSFAFRQGISK
jgi:4,5-DOPA dioxygenase extradiol